MEWKKVSEVSGVVQYELYDENNNKIATLQYTQYPLASGEIHYGRITFWWDNRRFELNDFEELEELLRNIKLRAPPFLREVLKR